jgi:hypothetical protein
VTSLGALPPASAQLCKYHVSHFRTFTGHAAIGMTGIMPTPGLCRIEVPSRHPGLQSLLPDSA